MSIFRRLWERTSFIWWLARQISGDAAYENYLRSAARQERGDAMKNRPMTAEKFYQDSLRRRYSQASRCC